MQNTPQSVSQTNILSEKLFLGIKWLIFGVILWFLYQSFEQKAQTASSLVNELRKIFQWQNSFNFTILMGLIVVNWGFEAKKWQILAHKFEVLSFKKAYSSVLIGLCLGFITPANIGDFAGRIWQLKNKQKTESIGAILLGNGIQFYVSLIFGAIAYLIIGQEKMGVLDQLIFDLLIFMLVLGIIIYARNQQMIQFLYRFSWIKKYQKNINSVLNFDSDTTITVLIWSILRYLTFSLQFILVLFMFGVNINLFDLWAVTALVFLYKTIIPTLNFFTDLGIREYSALHFFGMFSVNLSAVVVATFFLWLINILLPVLLGSILFLRLKQSK